MRKLVFGLLAFFGSVFIVLILLSAGWYLKDRFAKPAPRGDLSLYRESDIPGLPHEHVPGASGIVAGIPVKINNLGFRGPDISIQRPEGIIRIAVIGDSIIFGQGVPDQETLPALLQSLLAENCKGSWQVVNAGVRGYNTSQDAAFFRERVLSLSPDGVILGITEINDPEIEPFRYQPVRLENEMQGFWWKFAPTRMFMIWRAQEDYLEASRNHIRSLYDPSGRPWNNFIAALEDIKQQCSKSGAWLVAVTFPLLENENTFASERARLHEKLSELEIDFIDPKPALEKYSWRDLALSPKDLHPNALCQGIYAKLVFEKLRDLGHACSRQ